MTRSRWIIFVVLCVVILGGLVLYSKKDSVNVDNLDPFASVQSSSTQIGDHIYGKTDSKVILTEYGDFQCPYCGEVFSNVQKISVQYKDVMGFRFRNFPLTNLHPNALAAATAAEAVSLQGEDKYWKMHDLLYTNQNSWSDLDTTKRQEAFQDMANQTGVDINKYKADLSNKLVSDKISRDRAFGAKLGVDATPTFYLNKVKVSDDVSTDLINGTGTKLMALIDAQLKANNLAVPAATTTTQQ